MTGGVIRPVPKCVGWPASDAGFSVAVVQDADPSRQYSFIDQRNHMSGMAFCFESGIQGATPPPSP